MNNTFDLHPLKLSWLIVSIGASLGFILSWGSLTGDAQGRVNLFHLLVVYMLIPILSIIVSLGSALFGKGLNLAGLLYAIPGLQRKSSPQWVKLRQYHLDKFWLLMQSQAAALAFSIASLLTFVFLLLVTDINFIWRITLLDATDIFPFLQWIAKPWYFWQQAQPDFTLLTQTQDSRLLETHNVASNLGLWWKFILATQLFYSLFLRSIVFVSLRVWIHLTYENDFEIKLQKRQIKPDIREPASPNQSIITHQLIPPLVLNNWGQVPRKLISQNLRSTQADAENLSDEDLMTRYFIDEMISDPTATEAQQYNTISCTQKQLVLTRAWEPPLGELEDFLKLGCGYLCPMDWQGEQLQSLKQSDLEEWQRLLEQLPNWTLFVNKEYLPHE